MTPLVAAIFALGAAASAHAVDVRVTFTNLAPAGGVGVAPLWVGFHNGSFDAFDVGAGASVGIEHSAEDGNAAGLGAIFQATWPTGRSGTLAGTPAFPGDVRTALFQNVDLMQSGRYFSYAAMVVVSNDFFLGNDNPLAVDLSTLALEGGHRTLFVGTPGTVYDAGTEINDFNHSLANAAFGIGGGQSGPNEGADQHGVISAVTANPYPFFLNQSQVPAGYDWGPLDFTQYAAVGRIDIEIAAVPEPAPAAMLMAGLGVVGLLSARRRLSRLSA
jgi:hypothetical protein